MQGIFICIAAVHAAFYFAPRIIWGKDAKLRIADAYQNPFPLFRSVRMEMYERFVAQLNCATHVIGVGEMSGAADAMMKRRADNATLVSQAHLDVLSCILDLGEAMLTSGADVDSVENALVRMGEAYGAYKMDVLVITEVIILTAKMPGHDECTLSRRIVSEGSSNFDRLEALTDLCEAFCEKPISASELRGDLDRIKRKPFPRIPLYLGAFLSAGGFAVFFGGSIVDGVMSALFALGVTYLIKHFQPLTPNTIVFNFLASFISGILICLASLFVPVIDIDMVIIGVIMLLIPGVAMTNATRDMLSGATISGVMRFVESLFYAASLAIGFMGALWIARMLGVS